MPTRWAGLSKRKASFTDSFDKRERADSLSRLGFGSYRKYLASELWKSIRDRVLDRDKCACRRCGRPAKTVHHSNYGYDVMRGVRLESLYAICGQCHVRTGHADGAVQGIKPMCHVIAGKPWRPGKRIRSCEKWCEHCGVKLRRRNVCRRCQRHLDWHSELDREYRDMFQVICR